MVPLRKKQPDAISSVCSATVWRTVRIQATNAFIAIVVAIAVILPSGSAAASPVVAELYDFPASADGAQPASVLVRDASGSLYGTTLGGGHPAARCELGYRVGGCGVAFKLTPPLTSKGKWTETVIHKFGLERDGFLPYGGLVFGRDGVLYGTTEAGGAHGHGTVYKLTPPAAGKSEWTESVLYSFAGGADGSSPVAALIRDAAGALYGTTQYGGTHGDGAVYKLTPPAAGHPLWTEAVLHSFGGGADGILPNSPLTLTPSGALYGATYYGGNATGDCPPGNIPDGPYYGCGIVFRLEPPTAGKAVWHETILHAFSGFDDGGSPNGPLLVDAAGSVYGTTYQGGPWSLNWYVGVLGNGLVFRLDPPKAGHSIWTETVLYDFFTNSDNDGACPTAGLTWGAGGVLYGTTPAGPGGPGDFHGTVFQLTPPKKGGTYWSEMVLHSFTDSEGTSPMGGLINSFGALYGTTYGSQIAGEGPFVGSSVFKLTP